MPALASITPVDLQHLVATFDTAMDPASVNGGMNWFLSVSTAGAMSAVVTNATLRSNGQVVDIVVGAALTAGASYNLTASNAKTSLGTALPAPNKTLGFVAPSINGIILGYPHKYLQAVTRATGEELQTLSGRALTRLVSDFGEDDPVAFVETTLGFSNTGSFFVGPRKYTYTGKTDCSFTGCKKTREWDGTMLTQWTAVTYDPYSWVPEE
jgi:hypothetical protein